MTDKRTIRFEINVDADAKGVDRFAKSLKNLQESAPIADKELKKIRQGILDFATAAGTSEKVTVAVAAQLRTLQTEAKTGGTLWKQLSKDIDFYSGKIRQAEQAQKEFNKALNFNLTAPYSFAKLSAATGVLRKELDQLNIKSQNYVQTLVRIKELETVGSFNQGRLNAIAANQAFMGGTLARGYGSSERLPSLPDTIAGDSQRVAELTQRIQNLTRGSEEYLKVVNQVAAANSKAARSQEQLNRSLAESPVSTARQRLEAQRQATAQAVAERAALADTRAVNNSIRRNQERVAREQERLRRQAAAAFPPPTTLLLPGAGQTSFRGEFDSRGFGGGARARITGGESPLIIATDRSGRAGFRGANDYAGPQFGVNASAPTPAQRRPGELAGMFQEIERVTKASNGSIRSLQQQRQAWEALRQAVNPLAPAYRNAGAAIERLDAQLGELDGSAARARAAAMDRRRLGRRQLVQDIGTSASNIGVAGFFGGPEALLFAGAGALAGPGGAAAGASVGIGVSTVRQAVGGYATQAAELSKLRLALQSVVKTQNDYEVSLRTIQQASQELNLPVLEGTKQFTQLAAAVIGAGGNVSDAALAFNAVNSAIKATGGSTQDAEGALRAVVQVFSKGKVTAEELQGQIAERLPGAVTLFAKSIGKTGPELDKAFEQGEVGLKDFIKFLGQLDKDYADTARKISESSDEAGNRLKNAWQDAVLAIGDAFKPLGTSIQDRITKFLVDNKDEIKQWATAFINNVKAAYREIDRLARRTREYNEGLRFVMNGGNAYDFFTSRQLETELDKFTIQNWWKQIGGDAQSRSQIERQVRDVEDSITRLRQIELRGGSAGLIDQQILQQEAKLARLRTGLQRLREPAAPAPTNFPGAAGDPAAADDRKAKAEADRQLRLAQQLAADRQRLLEEQAQQEIRLAETVYRAKVELDNAQYANRRRLEDLQARAQMAYLSPAQRDAMSATLEFQRLRDEDSDRLREIDQRIKELNLSITNARKMAEVTAMAATVPVTAAPQAITGGGGNAIFGSTGNVRNARGWVHGHFQTNTGTLAQLIADTAPVVMALIRAGVPAELANGVKFRPGMTEEDIKRLLYQGAKLHRHSGDGRSVDVFVPEGTRMPVPLMDVRNTGGRGGVTGILPGSGNVWVGHLAPNSRSGGAGGLVRTPTGVAAQERRATVDMGDVKVLEVQRDALKALREEEEKGIKDRLGAQMTISIAERTQALRDNTVSIRENVQQMQDRARFTAEGFADYEVEALTEINRKQRESNELIAYYTEQKRLAEEVKDQDGVEYFTRAIQEQTKYLEENRQALLAQAQAQRELNEAAGKGIGFREGARQYVESIGTMREATAALTNTGLKGVEDMLVSLATTGTANFREFAASLLRDTTRLVIQQLILKTILQAIGAIDGPSLDSTVPNLVKPALNVENNVYGDGITQFAKGGVVEQPTLFKFAKGTGLMGEAGPEAIMPLKRGPDGRLGVSGGGGVNVTVNVSMDGGQSTDADSAQGAQLGRAVALAVQQELIKQKRPGGLLTK